MGKGAVRAKSRNERNEGTYRRGTGQRGGASVGVARQEGKKEKGKLTTGHAAVRAWKRVQNGGENAKPQHPPVTRSYPARRNLPGKYDQAIDQALSPDKTGGKPRKTVKRAAPVRKMPIKVNPPALSPAVPAEVSLLVGIIVEPFARLSDRTLDAVYHYGLSKPDTFGWEANQGSARRALELILSGETNIERISAAIHEGWGEVAKSYEDPIYQTKPYSGPQKLDN
jgi:hypothetical protein